MEEKRFRKKRKVAINRHICDKHIGQQWSDLVFETAGNSGGNTSTFYSNVDMDAVVATAKTLLRVACPQINGWLSTAADGERGVFCFECSETVGFAKNAGSHAPCPCDRIKIVLVKDRAYRNGFAFVTMYPFSGDMTAICAPVGTVDMEKVDFAVIDEEDR